MTYLKKYTGILLLLLLIIFKLQGGIFIKKIENISYDFYQSLFIEETDFERVMIIDIDEKSIAELGQFPWRRDIWGKIIYKLRDLGVDTIAFDIFFSEDDMQNPKKILKEYNLENDEKILDSDEFFLKAIKSSKIILPVIGDTSDVNKNNNSTPRVNIIKKGGDAKKFLYSFRNKITSIERFNNSAKGIGSISILDSEDGILRSIPLMLSLENTIWPALALETLRVRMGLRTFIIKSYDGGIEEIKSRRFKIKTDPNSIVFLKYKRYSQNNYISAVDILNDRVNENLLKNKIAIIGSSAQGLFDFVKNLNIL